MNNEFLPIGSIVLLKGGTKKTMVVGYLFSDPNTKNGKVFDYLAAVYPEGIFTLENFFAFDHKDILKIYSYGYVDDEQKELSRKLINIKNKYVNDKGELTENLNNITINELKEE